MIKLVKSVIPARIKIKEPKKDSKVKSEDEILPVQNSPVSINFEDANISSADFSSAMRPIRFRNRTSSRVLESISSPSESDSSGPAPSSPPNYLSENTETVRRGYSTSTGSAGENTNLAEQRMMMRRRTQSLQSGPSPSNRSSWVMRDDFQRDSINSQNSLGSDLRDYNYSSQGKSNREKRYPWER